MNVLDRITDTDLLQFGSNLNIQNLGTAGDTLFPNEKTDYLEAEYTRLAKSPTLPHAAQVHGFDTEAVIGRRPLAEVVRIEQLLIKEKLNMSERIMRLTNRGVNSEDAILNYIYDDLGNLATAVRTRTEVAKFEVLCTGKMRIAENGVNLEVDYGVPDDNRYVFNWFSNDHDILSDIRRIINAGRRKGQRYNRAMVSTAVMDLLTGNTNIQKAVNGTINAGVIVTQDGINSLFNRLFGFTVEVNDDYATYTAADGTETPFRLFDEYKMVLYVADNNGAVGTGLWGVTPEELDAGGFTSTGYSGFVYLSQWSTPDPVTRWSKASGVFIPVLPNPNGHVIISLTDGLTVLKSLDVTSTAGTSANRSKINVSTALETGNSLYYKVGNDAIDVDAGETIATTGASAWTALTNNSEITVTGKKAQVITVVEGETVSTVVEGETVTTIKAVGAGYAAIVKA